MKKQLIQNIIVPMVGITCLIITLQGCAPVFSEIQSARTVGKDNVEITPSYSSSGYANGGLGFNHLGFQFAYGISNNIDIRFRYEFIWSKGENFEFQMMSIIGVGPKINLLKDKISFYIPIGRGLGKMTRYTWEIQPTFLFTLPIVKDKVEVTLSPKYLVFTNSFAVNLGFSLSSNLSKWAIRPEYGMLFYPDGSGFYSQFSLGYSITFGN
jgi:hypothetical protein